MRKVLGSLGAALAVALVMAALPVSAGAPTGGDDLAAVVSDAPEGLRAKRRDLEAHEGSFYPGDNVTFSLPTAMAATPAGAAGPALGGSGVDTDGPDSVDTNSVALGTVRTPDAPQFGFDVSVQTAGVRLPYVRYPAFADL
jgi:hypothetical protein